jgi:hypothetical protein
MYLVILEKKIVKNETTYRLKKISLGKVLFLWTSLLKKQQHRFIVSFIKQRYYAF